MFFQAITTRAKLTRNRRSFYWHVSLSWKCRSLDLSVVDIWQCLTVDYLLGRKSRNFLLEFVLELLCFIIWSNTMWNFNHEIANNYWVKCNKKTIFLVEVLTPMFSVSWTQAFYSLSVQLDYRTLNSSLCFIEEIIYSYFYFIFCL